MFVCVHYVKYKQRSFVYSVAEIMLSDNGWDLLHLKHFSGFFVPL